MRNKLKGVCFGEILFDVFLEHKKIGGAPLNVALRIKSFGGDISIISAIGNDNDGKRIVEYINGLGIKTNTIQVKDNYPTGLVYITLNKKGNFPWGAGPKIQIVGYFVKVQHWTQNSKN